MERGEEPWAGRFHEYYDRVDASVGELVRRLPDECTLILLSDHGFCRLDREVYVNRWLERDGWVALEEPANVDRVGDPRADARLLHGPRPPLPEPRGS